MTTRARRCKYCLLICLLSLSCLTAAGAAQNVTAQEAKEALANKAISSLQAGDVGTAASFIHKIKQIDPKDPLGYQLAVQLYWKLKRVDSVVWEVLFAEKNHGVRSLDLYLNQAEALYLLSGYGPVLPVLDKIESLLKEQKT